METTKLELSPLMLRVMARMLKQEIDLQNELLQRYTDESEGMKATRNAIINECNRKREEIYTQTGVWYD